MKQITSLVWADKADAVKERLNGLNVLALTTNDVRDHSPQNHPTGMWMGHHYCLGFTVKTEIRVVVHDDDVDEVVKAIICAARTGRIGDGFVSIAPVDHRYNIRTGEREVS